MKNIIKKYLEGKANINDQAVLLKWLRYEKNRPEFLKSKLEWKKDLDKSWFPEEGRECWNNIQSAFSQQIYVSYKKSRKIYLISRYVAVFFLIFMLSAGTLGVIFKKKLKAIHYSNVMAEKGQISKVKLPDGSLVWLNSGSQLSYNNFFAFGNRDVNLTGEAFFDVKRNEKIPFVVSCNDLKVRVKGTKFNVASYPEDRTIDVVLEHGSVELFSEKYKSLSSVLRPGELAHFDAEKLTMSISEVNTTKFTSWKNGVINIYNQPLREVVKRLEIRYNQKFDYEKEVENFPYTFTIKNEPLSNVIQLMEKITPVKVVQKEDLICFRLDRKKMKKAERSK